MRLLNTDRIEIEQFWDDEIPRYAILSHAWEQDEVLFQDMQSSRAANKKGYDKVKSCCYVARANGYDYVWIDTCCIDKTSSAELSEAINSMYRWYQEASVCYSYLADVSTSSELSSSRWFTRGWTLQELIAPSDMIFFDKKWKEMGTKSSLGERISDRTGIPHAILSGSEPLETASLAQRMSWAAGRNTTKTEDRAYCLMGIFNINMPLLYGEGEKAFVRLQEEIMRVSDDQSLFAWRHPGGRNGFLAVTPDAFKDSGNIIPWNPLTPYSSPFTFTNMGVHLDAPFIAQGQGGLGLIILHCTEVGNRDHLIAVHLRDSFLTMEHFERCKTEEFRLINLKRFSPSQYPTRSICIRLQGPAPLSRGTQGASFRVQGSQSLHLEKRGQACGAEQRAEIRNVEGEEDPQRKLSLAVSGGCDADVRRLLALRNIQADLQDSSGRTPLSLAAAAGNERVVELLLNRRDVDINSKGREGYSPLSYASAQGHEGVVWLLLARSDIVVRSEGKWGRTLLSLAARGGHDGLVSQLLARKDTQAYLVDGKGQSVLSHAAEKGHETVVRLLLGSGKVHPDLKDQAGRTPLWYASMNGHEAVVKLLLETGWVDASSKDNEGLAVIWHAASNGHELVVKLLLENHADTRVEGRDGRTPLCQASANGHTDIVEMLLDNGAVPDVEGSDGQTALWHACEKEYDAIVKLLLDKGADPNAKGGEWALPALQNAASKGHETIVRLLLEKGANFVTRDPDDTVTLMGLNEAAGRGHDTVVKLLLEQGTRNEIRHHKIFIALSNAIDSKHEAIARVLIESAGSLEEAFGPYHLIKATLNRDEAIARLLLDKGVNVNWMRGGYQVLHKAADSECWAIVESLLGRSSRDWKYDDAVNVLTGQPVRGYLGRNEQDGRSRMRQEMAQGINYEVNPLWCATMNGDDTLVELFLRNGADIEARFKNNKTVLIYAVSEGHESIVRRLLAEGADVEAKDSEGHTPLVYATKKNNMAMVKLLLENGANPEAESNAS